MALEKKTTRGRGTGKKAVLVVIALAWLGATAFLAYAYFDNRNDTNQLRSELDTARQELETYKNNPEEAARAEVQRYVAEVGKVYALPEGEDPSVATVSDKSKLEDQPFFEKAENGDITLIYTKAKLAILYRPSNKQIVNVSSVTIQQNAEQ